MSGSGCWSKEPCSLVSRTRSGRWSSHAQSDGYDFECRGCCQCMQYMPMPLGWLDAGCSIGIISAGNPDRDGSYQHRNLRITGTYGWKKRLHAIENFSVQPAMPLYRHLTRAVSSVRFGKIIMTGRTFLIFGETAMGITRMGGTLLFSYGFGWL